MGDKMNDQEWPAHEAELNDEVRAIWNGNAAFWDGRMGEGNDFHKTLIEPAQERLLALKQGELVLDAACGNGQFTRHMARLGARVVAFDFSEVFIERARARTTENSDKIEYRVLDATDREGLLALGRGRFDAAVCTMALMDMARIEPLIESLGQLLKPGGRFVFSVLHPCFNASGVKLVCEQEELESSEIVNEYAVKVSKYIRPLIRKGIGIIGQPAPHYYFNRPISELLGACFHAGFVLDGLEEPVFGVPTADKKENLFMNVYSELPAALVARLRWLGGI